MSTYKTFKAVAETLGLCSKTGAYKLAHKLAQSQRAEAGRLAEVQGLAAPLVAEQLEYLIRAHRLLAQYAEAIGLAVKAQIDGRQDSMQHWRKAADRAFTLAKQACEVAEQERWIPEPQEATQQPL